MTGDLPSDLGGNNPLVAWLNKLKRALIRRTLQPGLGYKLRQTEQGTTLEILPQGGGAVSVSVIRCVVTAVRPNSLLCEKVSDSTSILVAKPFKLRNYITRQTVGSDVISFSYDSTPGSTLYQLRTASASGRASETQVVVPRYLTTASIGTGLDTDEIWAVSLSSALWQERIDLSDPSSTLTDVEYLDINADGRAWARQRA